LYLLGAPSDTNFIAEKFGARKVTGHNVVIVGGGRVGAEVARQISDFGFRVKIIEKNPERCKELAGQLPGVLVLEGDGVDSKLMAEENLGKADIFVCVTSDEAANLLSAAIGKQMGAGKVIALIKRGDMFATAYALGVDVVVNARLAVADRILRHLQRDRILSMFTFPGEDLEALEFVVKDRQGVTEVPIKELSLPEGVLIGAISRKGEVILPSGSTMLQAGDRVILFARYADHQQMEALFLN
ncbi:MAG: NAD-binding protein, partial [bacterium]|nr:NAD-binding protein [bacterium]